MARVTIEDCLRNVKNRFELVMIAAKRARQLMRGKEPKVEWDNDKATVVALREIAEGFTNFDHQEMMHELHHPETHTLHLTTEVELTEIDLKEDDEAKEATAQEAPAAPEVEKTQEASPEEAEPKPPTTTPPTETE